MKSKKGKKLSLFPFFVWTLANLSNYSIIKFLVDIPLQIVGVLNWFIAVGTSSGITAVNIKRRTHYIGVFLLFYLPQDFVSPVVFAEDLLFALDWLLVAFAFDCVFALALALDWVLADLVLEVWLFLIFSLLVFFSFRIIAKGKSPHKPRGGIYFYVFSPG